MRSHPHLLELSAWPWLDRVSRGERRVVTLADVPAARWDGLAAGGFDAVYLMGVWRRSAVGRDIARTDAGLIAEYDRVLPGWTPDDVPGSPYCIQAYEPDPRMGGWHGLDTARHELRRRGLSLFLDFVPNHTGFDHAWVIQYPERYVLGSEEDYRQAPLEFRTVAVGNRVLRVACGRDPYFPPWTDVAQLNHFNPDTRTAMQATLRDIAAHCDGVRCDMAMLVLNEVFERTWRRLLRDAWSRPPAEFWVETTRDISGLVYLAEVYWALEGRMLEQGFTYAYDKRLFDVMHGANRAAGARALFEAPAPEPRRLARFLENHDEPRSLPVLGRQLPAAVALLVSSPGLRFFYDGQFEGRRIKAPVQLGRWPDEPVDEDVRTLYERALDFAGDAPLHEGEWKPLPPGPAGDDTSRDIVACRWRSAGGLAVVAANLGDGAAQAHLAIADDLPPGDAFDFADHLTGAAYRWMRGPLCDRGLYVRLEAGRAHLFRVQPRVP